MAKKSAEAGEPRVSRPVAIVAAECPADISTIYPAPFAPRVAGREKRRLGAIFGLANFGVNLTRLSPRSVSSLRHAHATQDEFVYILEGCASLYTDEGRIELSRGMCAGFKAGTGNAHHIVNETAEDVVYLEIGDRSPGDAGTYPDDDLQAILVEGEWHMLHKDGRPYGSTGS